MNPYAVFNYRFEFRGVIWADTREHALRMVPQQYPFVFGAMVEPYREENRNDPRFRC